MIYQDEANKTLYISDSINAEDLIKVLMEHGGLSWRTWTIGFLTEYGYAFDDNYGIEEGDMLNKMELFQDIKEN